MCFLEWNALPLKYLRVMSDSVTVCQLESRTARRPVFSAGFAIETRDTSLLSCLTYPFRDIRSWRRHSFLQGGRGRLFINPSVLSHPLGGPSFLDVIMNTIERRPPSGRRGALCRAPARERAPPPVLLPACKSRPGEYADGAF